MTPELQSQVTQAQQNIAAAQRNAECLGYATYAAIILCAVFSAFIFWKLCQIQKNLATYLQCLRAAAPPPARFVPAETIAPADTTTPVRDDSRYMPKG